MNSLLRQNYWTGLRFPSDGVYNWSVYYCLFCKIDNKAPLDDIMILINEYLNWLPITCWNISTMLQRNRCVICGCGCWIGDIKYIPVPDICSYECVEKVRRNAIIDEYNYFSKIIHKFSINPIYAIELAEINLEGIINTISYEYEMMLEYELGFNDNEYEYEYE